MQSCNEQTLGELHDLCFNLMRSVGDDEKLTPLRNRATCWLALEYVVLAIDAVLIFGVLAHLPTGIGYPLAVVLVASLIPVLFKIEVRHGKEFRSSGKFETELTALKSIIAQHKPFLTSVVWDELCSDDRRLAIRAFMRYSLRCLAVSTLEKDTLVPVTDRQPNRFGVLCAQYYGAFEPDCIILQALGKLILIDGQSSSQIESAEIASTIGDLRRLRSPSSNERLSRRTMPDADYVAVQTQFVQYLGCYGDSSSLHVLGTLARDKRYPALRTEAKQAIEQVQSRLAGANCELLHIPSPAQDSDLLRSTGNKGESKES